MSDFDISLRMRLIDQVSDAAAKIERELKDIKGTAQGLGSGVTPAKGLKGAAAEAGAFKSAIKGAANEIDRSNVGLANVAAGATALGVKAGTALGSGVVLALFKAQREARSLESSMVDVKKQMSDTSPDAVEEITDAIRETARQTGIAKELIAELTAEGLKAGILQEDAADFAGFAAKTAIAFDMTPGAAGGVLGQLKSSFKLDLDQLKELADQINVVADTTSTSEPKVIGFLQDVAANADNLGIAVKKMATLGGALTAVGMDPSRAARATNAMLSRLAAPPTSRGGKAFHGSLKILGLDAKQLRKSMQADSFGALVDLVKRVKKVPEPLDRMAIFTGLAGGEFADELSSLVNQLEALEKLQTAIAQNEKDGKLSVEKSFEAGMATTDAAFARLGTAFDDLAVTLGKKLLPLITQFAEGLTSVIDWINDLIGGGEEEKRRQIAVKQAYGQPLRESEKKKIEADPQAQANIDAQSAAIRERRLAGLQARQLDITNDPRLRFDNDIGKTLRKELAEIEADLKSLEASAGNAGQQSGDAFKLNLSSELSTAEILVAGSIARMQSMLSFSASPTISPRFGPPAPSTAPAFKPRASLDRGRGNTTVVNNINVASADKAGAAVARKLAASLSRASQGAMHDGVA
jgi:TP901 family phage tail tape measure protein